MTESLEKSKLVEHIFRALDFPVVVVTEDGRIVTVSPGAELLMPALMTRGAGASFLEYLAEKPDNFRLWLKEAEYSSAARIGSMREGVSASILVKAAPCEALSTVEKLWVLSLHREESFSRQKYEREILLRISSVPIPEMAAEGSSFTADSPESGPITRDLLSMVMNYLGGHNGLLMKIDDHRRISIIGQSGFTPGEIAAMLKLLSDGELMFAVEDGLLCNACRDGFPYSLDDQDNLEPPLKNICEQLPFKHAGIWIDGISGFGVALTFFRDTPDHTLRQFATDAYVRLGRHLETCVYSNQLLDAYLQLKNSQEQIIQAGKMAAIGEMATGMAHELRQPVTAISNFTSTIFDYLEKKQYQKLQERLDDFRERTRRNIERLTRIIDHLRIFGRQEVENFQSTDMHALIDEILDTFLNSQLSRHNIALIKFINPDQTHLEMDGPRIEQVILNLMANAVDALEGVPEPAITISLASSEDTMRFSISDNGPGIPPEIINRILDPFFTTKAAGKGTGLGLSVSHGIVKGHNGEIYIENLPNGGVCFVVELPLRQT